VLPPVIIGSCESVALPDGLPVVLCFWMTGGQIVLRALAASVSMWPLFQSSNRVFTSAFTVVAEAPGFCGPMTKVGKRKRPSQAASRRTVPPTSAALVSSSVITGSS
jgi:hypothetical protein